jgi:histidinol-phosphate/aromatic aminotransferase/cobyric acid decarboxylase-like protein
MAQFDRREWLRMISLVASSSIGAQQLFAEPAQDGKSPGAAEKLIRLSLNENPYGPAPNVIAAIQREFANLCRYTDFGYGQLVAGVAAKERLPTEQIILGEILEPLGTHLSLQGGPGGEFIYSDPGYTALIDSAVALGGIGIPIPLSRSMQNDLVREGENVIVFRTFAKVYGLAGMDIGYGLVPTNISQVLKKRGLDNPHLFNRVAVAAAAASLEDTGYVSAVAAKVAQERDIWFSLFHELKVHFTESNGNFVFFETGIPHREFSAALLQKDVDIGRAFPPYERWARISIGLPHENASARIAVHDLLSKK